MTSATAPATADATAGPPTASTADARVATVPVSQLQLGTNIRHHVGRDSIDEMKASVLASGVLQNVIAAPLTGTEKFAVFAGGTRLMAVRELVDEGSLDAAYEVPTLIYDDLDPESTDAIAIAMLENMVRSQMDYVDECAAMLQLAEAPEARKGEDEIAAIFGYTARTVRERLLIAKLIPDAHKLVRDKTRTLGWARALTLADAAMQKQICTDIAANPNAWESGEDIRKFLTRATIPAENAIFDLGDYAGEIVPDFFDGDKLADTAMFWRLQNAAVEELRTEIEAEGFREVHVLHEPFPSWKYDDESDPAQALAFIEVLAGGVVTVIRGKRPVEEPAEQVAPLDVAERDADGAIEEIADFEVRATKGVADYAAAQRSAMLQARLADDFRASLEYTAIAMIGHRGASFSARPYAFAGDGSAHTGKAFHRMGDVTEAVHETTATDAATPEAREAETVAMVRSMEDGALQALFAQLVAQRAGQEKRRGIDDAPGALTNVFGAEIEIRDWWTPDETFFELMASEDLRRLATELLPGASATRFASAKKKDLVRALASNFADARDGVLTGEVARTLNAWIPGIMTFPAEIAMKAEAGEVFADADDDLDATLFGAAEEAA